MRRACARTALAAMLSLSVLVQTSLLPHLSIVAKIYGTHVA